MTEPKPRLGFQVEPGEAEAVDAVTEYVRRNQPGLGSQAKSAVMRAALRLGLPMIARDAGLVTSTPPLSPSIRTGRPAWSEASVKRSPAADDLTGRTKDLLEGLTPEEEKERQRRAKARRKGESKAD